jgi:hypothetical protein
VFRSRPEDRSLQAYKDWIRGTALALDRNAEDNVTAGEWCDSKDAQA